MHGLSLNGRQSLVKGILILNKNSFFNCNCIFSKACPARRNKLRNTNSQ